MKNRIAAIDGMKGIHALAIACIYHLGTLPYPYTSGLPMRGEGWEDGIRIIDWIYKNGFIFVESFFICSGYLSFSHYTSKIEMRMTFDSFMKRRMIRIFPLMWITLLTACAGEIIYYNLHKRMFWYAGGNSGNSIYTLLLNILGLQGFFSTELSWNYPAWSLSVFFVCWGIWYGIVYRYRKNRGRIYACVVMVILGVTLQTDLYAISIPLLNGTAARGYISFFMGGIIFYSNEYLDEKKRQAVGWISLCWLVLCMVLYADGISIEPFQITMSVAIWPFVLLAVVNIPVLNKIFSCKPFVFLGKISFSIYLCNYSVEIFTIIFYELFQWNINFSGKWFFFGNMIVQVMIASFFYWVFERKIPNKWKKVTLNV